MAEYSQKWDNGTSRGRSTETSDGLTAIQAQLNNLGREIKRVNEKVYATQVGYAAIRNKGASIKTLEIQIRQNKQGSSISVVPLLTYLNLRLSELSHTRLTVELADRTMKYPKGIAKNVLVGIGKFTFPIDFIFLDMPKDIKVPLILGRPFLSTARSKIDDYPSYCDDDKKIHINFLENMDAYRNEGMGDVIVGEPFLREVGIKAK
ncbi:reverse transcriptase domain-containing protein [Tanacetum coccineum]